MKEKSLTDEYELKKYEELYSLSKSELEKGHTRFGLIEEKATRHFSLLIVLLGFVSVGIPEYVSIAKSQMTYYHWIFVFLYPLLALSVLVSIFCYMRAISFSRYKNIVLDTEMFDHFKKNKYVDVIFSLSKRYADDLVIINRATDKKVEKANLAFRFTHISLVLIVLTIILYIIIRLQ
jgi:hypothetical protein